MSVGTGIAIAGAWGFAAACAFAPQVTGQGLSFAAILAFFCTCLAIGAGAFRRGRD